MIKRIAKAKLLQRRVHCNISSVPRIALDKCGAMKTKWRLDTGQVTFSLRETVHSSTHARSHGFTEAIVVYFCDHDYVNIIHRQQHIYICIYEYIYIYIWMLYVNIYVRRCTYTCFCRGLCWSDRAGLWAVIALGPMWVGFEQSLDMLGTDSFDF